MNILRIFGVTSRLPYAKKVTVKQGGNIIEVTIPSEHVNVDDVNEALYPLESQGYEQVNEKGHQKTGDRTFTLHVDKTKKARLTSDDNKYDEPKTNKKRGLFG